MIEKSSPFPFDGGRVGVGGGSAVHSGDGAEGVVGRASRAPLRNDCAHTPSQPSPVEGEGLARFARTDGKSTKAIRRAKNLRSKPTRTETNLWERLRLLSVRFRRQEPIGPYIVDFVCHRANLVIEVDGGVHDQTDVAIKDLQRDTWLATQGYEVVRFSNKAVSEDIEAVVSNIRRIVSNRLGKVI